MNSFGRFFRISVFGESHGNSVGITIDGCPAGLPLSESDFLSDLSRRKSGGKGTTPRIEGDIPKFASGIFKGHTTGAPLTILFENTNTKHEDYAQLKETPRPGHADFTASQKFGGFQDHRGGGQVNIASLARRLRSPLHLSTSSPSISARKELFRTSTRLRQR